MQPSNSPLTITPVPCLQDNYAYLIEHTSGDAWVVDPSEAAPVLAIIAQRRLRLRGIIATHHHHDHVGGIAGLVAASDDPQLWVAAHAHDSGRIPCLTRPIAAPLGAFTPTKGASQDGRGVELAGVELWAMWIPGHTDGAIAWMIPGPDGGDVFTGDTLFAAGCGRLFEGTPAQMYSSLRALAELAPATRLWFGHEYTAGNLRFAAVIEPDNFLEITRAAAELPAITTPTTVARERALNPFVRAASLEEFTARRAAKDTFRG